MKVKVVDESATYFLILPIYILRFEHFKECPEKGCVSDVRCKVVVKRKRIGYSYLGSVPR